jgi:hypothetical protein
MPQKSRQVSKVKSISTNRGKYKEKSAGQYDTPRNLVIGGVIGLILFYIVISRALDTGSYWEYFFALAIIIISIRLFIRSIRLK